MSNKGNTILAVPIVWTITIFIFIFFIVMSVRVMEPFLVYQKMSETALKYIFVMEEYGCLNKDEKDALCMELESKGLERKNIILTTNEDVVEYGDIVELNLSYKHPYKKTSFSAPFLPIYEEKFIEINVSKKGVSKR